MYVTRDLNFLKGIIALYYLLVFETHLNPTMASKMVVNQEITDFKFDSVLFPKGFMVKAL